MSGTPSETPLGDGTHDVFVIDVTEVIDRPGAQQLELTVVSGPHKGMVLSLVSATPLGDEVDLIGMPATLTVTEGVPTVVIDD